MEWNVYSPSGRLIGYITEAGGGPGCILGFMFFLFGWALWGIVAGIAMLFDEENRKIGVILSLITIGLALGLIFVPTACSVYHFGFPSTRVWSPAWTEDLFKALVVGAYVYFWLIQPVLSGFLWSRD